MKLPVLALCLVLAGCANQDYKEYAETQKHIAASNAAAQIARYNALAEIAKQGDTTSKVAAVMSLQFGQQADAQPRAAVRAPTSTSDQVLRWASLIVPSLVQGYGMYENARVATVQSNNNREITVNNSNNNALTQQHSNSTMLGIAELITIPEPVVVEQPAPVIVDPVVVQPDPIIVNPVVVDPVIVDPVVVPSAP